MKPERWKQIEDLYQAALAQPPEKPPHSWRWLEALELLASRPAVNIEGLVAGYNGARRQDHPAASRGGQAGSAAGAGHDRGGRSGRLRAHLARRGFGDIEVNMTGGYDPTTTPADAGIVRAAAVYRRNGIDPIMWPRLAGSWPGFVFTGDPLRLPAGHFGLGHGNGAHAPNEYYVIESGNPKIQGMDGAARSHVEYLYELAAV
jgi:hypothetical protein